MHQGQDQDRASRARTRPGRSRRLVLGLAAVAAVTSAGIGATAGQAPAGAATQPAPRNAAPATTTRVVSPTTSVTTTTRPRSVTTATTTVTTGPGSVTSTTVTTVTTTTTAPPRTTTTTTAPPRTTTTSTTTTVPVPTTTTTTTTVPVPSATTTTVAPTTTVPPTTVPPPGAPDATAFDPTCTQPATPGLQTYLDSLPAGSTFTSSTTACYLVPVGIRLTQPITIVGGTFYDPTDTRTPGDLYNSLKPIILIKDTSNVTLNGVTVLGGNSTGGFHRRLVGQAGVKIMSSSNVSLDGILARNTYGDGLELVSDHLANPVTGLKVEGYTTINAGRQGVTVAEVSGGLLDHVTIIDPADAGVDFESDLAGVGSGNVMFTNCSDDRGFQFNEYFSGPITVADCTQFHHVSLFSPTSTASIAFVGGTLACKRADPWPCVYQAGGSLSFTGVTVNRMPGVDRITEPIWNVVGGGKLAFISSPIEVPMGSVAPGSALVRR